MMVNLMTVEDTRVSQKVFSFYYGISVIFCLASSWVGDGLDPKTNYRDTHFNHIMMFDRLHNPHALKW
jgi:hypothetical protein